MNRLEIPDVQATVEYPSSWEECSGKQVLFIFRHALLLLAGKISVLDFLLHVFFELAGIRVVHPELSDRRLTYEQRERKYENICRACETINFMFEHQDGKTTFRYDQVENQVPDLRIGLSTWHSPEDGLLDLTFGEYRQVVDLMRSYRTGNADKDLDKIIAILYRPAGKDGQRRKAFDRHECESRASRASKISPEMRFYVVSWFSSCDNYLKTGDLMIEGRYYNLSCLFTRQPDTEEDEDLVDHDGNLGLLGIQMAIAESGTFGDMESVDRANLYSVLLKLYQWKKENDKLKSHGQQQ